MANDVRDGVGAVTVAVEAAAARDVAEVAALVRGCCCNVVDDDVDAGRLLSTSMNTRNK